MKAMESPAAVVKPKASGRMTAAERKKRIVEATVSVVAEQGALGFD